MTQGTALLKASDEAKKALLEKILIYEENLEYLQERILSGGNQISRSNKTVEKLHTEGKELREKIKLKGEIIRKQVIHGFLYTVFFILFSFFKNDRNFILLTLSIVIEMLFCFYRNIPLHDIFCSSAFLSFYLIK